MPLLYLGRLHFGTESVTRQINMNSVAWCMEGKETILVGGLQAAA